MVSQQVKCKSSLLRQKKNRGKRRRAPNSALGRVHWTDKPRSRFCRSDGECLNIMDTEGQPSWVPPLEWCRVDALVGCSVMGRKSRLRSRFGKLKSICLAHRAREKGESGCPIQTADYSALYGNQIVRDRIDLHDCSFAKYAADFLGSLAPASIDAHLLPTSAREPQLPQASSVDHLELAQFVWGDHDGSNCPTCETKSPIDQSPCKWTAHANGQPMRLDQRKPAVGGVRDSCGGPACPRSRSASPRNNSIAPRAFKAHESSLKHDPRLETHRRTQCSNLRTNF